MFFSNFHPEIWERIHFDEHIFQMGWNHQLDNLGGGFNVFFNVHPYLGKVPILTNIFQMGWNHQLDNLGGGFNVFFNFHPEIWGRWTHFD